MGILANEIEKYLKDLLRQSSDGVLELRRTELAEIFTCVPSQINYVLETRFANSHGYHVESRRGGGGFIRIVKLAPVMDDDIRRMLEMIDGTVSQSFAPAAGEALIQRLAEEGFLTNREAALIAGMISPAVLRENLEPGLIRAAMLRSVLVNILRKNFYEE